METGVKHTIEIDEMIVSPSGRSLIREYLFDRGLPISLLETSYWTWQWVKQTGIYRGKLPKRLARVLKGRYDKLLTADQMSEIGNIARKHILPPMVYTLDFDEGLSWYAGDFGDWGSCFWADNALARDVLRKNGALAIRLYSESGSGYARAWIYKVNRDIWVLFNAYGETTQTMANIFAVFLSGHAGKTWEYDGISLSVNGDDHELVYFNSNPQVIFVTGADPPDEIDLDWYIMDYVRCYWCEAFVAVGEEYDYRGEIYCQDCYNDRVVQCVDCGDIIESAMDEFACDEGALCSLCYGDRESSEV